MDSCEIQGKFGNQVLTLESAKGNILGGTFKANGLFSLLDKPDAPVSLKVDLVDVEAKMAASILNIHQTEGTISEELRYGGTRGKPVFSSGGQADICASCGAPPTIIPSFIASNCPAPGCSRRSSKWAVAAVATSLLLALVGFLGRHVWTVFSKPTIDDAAITYAYAANVAAGNGFRHTPGASPVEGFSNPLEVLLLVPFAALHAQLGRGRQSDQSGSCLAGSAGVGALADLEDTGRGMPARPSDRFAATFWPTFNYWTVAGLEGGILAGLMALSTLCLLLAPASPGWDLALGLVAGLLAWTRPEAGLYGALALAMRLLSRRRRFFASAIFALALLLVLVFRCLCFRDLVPNTFWPKMGAGHAWQEGWTLCAVLSQWQGHCVLPLSHPFARAFVAKHLDTVDCEPSCRSARWGFFSVCLRRRLDAPVAFHAIP